MMDANRLGENIATAVISVMSEPPSGADKTELENLWKAVSAQIVLEISTFMQADVPADVLVIDPNTYKNLPGTIPPTSFK